MEGEVHSHKGGYLKYRSNGWKEQRELEDMMEQRTVNVLCLQETKWKGSKARNIGGGCKLFYNGVNGRNGIRIVVRKKLVKSVLEVKRVLNRLMVMKLEIKEPILNIVSTYAPRIGTA